ncbi:MAG: hypothetical protein DRR06_12530 [Gammaproteobacteria bacterium]|nr:MAG: hypothetical protein DRR06_12530 [Gammaproteobacteria bacterium]
MFLCWVFLVLLLPATLMMSGAANSAQLDLFVLAGQSNMQGWKSNASDYPQDDTGLDSGIKFYWQAPGISSSGGRWVDLQPQAGLFANGHFGPEVTFARELKKAGYSPAIFKFSLGGTSLGVDWGYRGDNGLYDQMTLELKDAIAQLRERGNEVVPRALVWVQGESDANRRLAREYQLRLKNLIDDMRLNVLGDAQLPIILGVDEQHPDVRLFPEVVLAQQSLATSGPNIVYTSMWGLEKSDATHLTAIGAQGHGVRLFVAYIDLISFNTNKLGSAYK